MKKVSIFLMACIAAVLMFTTSTITAEKVYDGSSDYKVENILLGNPGAKFETLDGTPLLMAQFDPNTTELKPDEINDGNVDRFQSVIKVNQTGLKSDPGVVGWAIFDLGETHYVEEIRTSFWNDWAFVDVVMQFASDENFTQDVVTVYNNDTDNSVGQGFGTDGVYSDAVDKTQNIHISARGRYFRVTNKGNGQSYSLFTEIQLYGITEGVMPAASTVPSGAYLNDLHVELFAGEGLEEIRYTLDGSIPTKKSTLYTGAFEIEMPVGGGIYLLRTVAYYQDGTVSYPKSYTYKFGFEGNAAYGKGAKLMDYSWNEIEGFAFNSDGGNPPGSPATVTDGAINPWSVYATKENVLGWAVVDFGDVYSINEVRVKAYHDWKFRNVIIQLSTEADFSANVYTVFNNDTTNTVGQGVGIDGAYQEYSFELRNIFSFDPVQARYIRFTNDASVHEGKTISLFEEIQAFSVLGVEAPAEVQPILNVKTLEDLKVNINTTQSEVIAQLPTTVELVDAKNNEFTVEGTWSSLDYNGDKVGNYILTFVPNSLDDSIFDFFNLFDINVEVKEAIKTGLSAKVAEAELLEEVKYTTSSWNEFAEKLATAKTILLNVDSPQALVDDSIVELGEVITKLVLRGDKTLLNSKIAEVELLEAAKYVASTWSELTNKLAAAKTVSANVDALQAEIDNALSELQTTLDNLELRGDKTLLNSKIAEVELLEAAKYVTSTWSELTNKLAAAKTVSANVDALQAEIDNALSELQTSLDNLELRGDKTALNTKITEAETLIEAEYIPSSWAALQTKLLVAKTVSANVDAVQSEVDAALLELQTAIDKLVTKLDKIALNAKITEAEALIETNYETAGWTALQTKLQTAKNIAASIEELQENIDTAVTELDAAIAALVKVQNKTELNAKITAVEALLEINYEAAGWTALQTKLQAAKSLSANKEVLQTELDAALSELSAAMLALVKVVDKALLNAKIESVNELEESIYEAEGWTALMAKLDAAKAVSENQEALQSDVNAALTELEAAIAALVKVEKKGLSTGLIVLIVVAGAAVVGLAVYGIIKFIKK